MKILEDIMDKLFKHIDDIHTTPMGIDRISKILGLKDQDVVLWCKNAVLNATLIKHLNKNYYVYFSGAVITINASSFTIITAHKISPSIREINESDFQYLEEFLYYAIFIPNGVAKPSRDIVFKPEIYIYIDSFGENKCDTGVVAEQNGQIIGMAWARIISAYGNIDDNIPELAISVLPEFRNLSVGTKLMRKLFVLLKDKGYDKLSLSVQKENKAVNFYIRLGFKIVKQKDEEYIMLKTL